jgi:hypothetical protein
MNWREYKLIIAPLDRQFNFSQTVLMHFLCISSFLLFSKNWIEVNIKVKFVQYLRRLNNISVIGDR